VVARLPLDPRLVGPNPVEADGDLIAIKICSTTSIGGKVKPSVPCHTILRHVKKPYEYEKILRRKNSTFPSP
jgi:hypothetical protein